MWNNNTTSPILFVLVYIYGCEDVYVVIQFNAIYLSLLTVKQGRNKGLRFF
jgi:hypothetical protein